MYSLFLARKEIEGKEFILCNGDVAFFEETILRFSDNGRSEILIDFDRFTEDNMKVLIDPDGFIRELSKNVTEANSHGVSLDLYKFNSTDSISLFNEIEDQIDKGNLMSWTEVAIAKLCKNFQVHIEAINVGSDSWYEIDNLHDLKEGRRKFVKNFEIEKFESIICDLDGTLLNENVAIEGAVEVLNQLSNTGCLIFYLTNNSGFSDLGHRDRLIHLGFPVRDQSIISSTKQTLLFLAESGIRDIYLFGTESVSSDFLREGFRINSRTPEMVVICNHTEFTYSELSVALKFIHSGVPYLLTHRDFSRPTPNGPMPDAGAVGLLIQEITGIQPLRILGKPSPDILRLIPGFQDSRKSHEGRSKSHFVIIGDRLELDVKLGLEAEISTVLVLSGSTSEVEFQSSDYGPDLVVETIADFL
jgi:HAD superfamily hydrolase (TIGR01450 family)